MPLADPQTLATSSVPPSAMPLISPNALLHAHLKQSPPQRPSGRSPLEARSTQLNVGSLSHCNGSSLVKIGATTIVCGVRAQILPVSEIPNFRVTKTSQSYDSSAPVRRDGRNKRSDGHGYSYNPISLYNLLVPNIELATGCSPRHPANTMPSIEAQSLSQRLLSLLHTSALIEPSQLEVVYTPPIESQDPELGIDNDPEIKAFWTLYIDIMCISHGGSIFDAAWLAIYAALKDTEIPHAWWDGDLEQVLCSADRGQSLSLHGLPVPNTFGVFVPDRRGVANQSTDEPPHWIVADMDAFEETSCTETCCITIEMDATNGETSILRLEKTGGAVLDVGRVKDLLATAESRWRHWDQLLNSVFRS
jgi:exosome complex component RRP43